MDLTFWDLLINVAAMLFWFRLWVPDERDLYFNPHLAALWRFSEYAVGGLRSVFGRTPDRLVALTILITLLVVRGVLFFGLARRYPEIAWQIRLGVERIVLNGHGSTVFPFLLFSLFSFGICLFMVWALATLYAGRKFASLSPAARALFHIAHPFSLIPAEWRPFALLGIGMLLVGLINLAVAATVGAPLAAILDPISVVKYALSALGAWVNALDVLQVLLLVLIIGSWAAMFSTSPELGYFCQEWIDLLLGPLRRFPLRFGMFDLTPVLFFFGLKFVVKLLEKVLLFSLRSLP